MNWESFFSGAIGAGVLAIALRVLDSFLTRNKAKAETGVLKSEASENITEAAQVAANVLLQALTFKQVENREYQERVRALEENQKKNDLLIDELTRRKTEREEQIAELQEHNEAMQSKLAALQAQIEKDTAETQILRDEVQMLRNQVADGEKKYKAAKLIIEQLVAALRKNEIDLPNLDLSDLGDSIHGLKWDKKP